MITVLLFLACFVVCELFFGWYFERCKKMGCHDYVKTLLKSGVSLEKKRVYLSQSGSNYTVLNLKDEYKRENEHFFGPNEFAEALDKFSELTNAESV